MKVLVRSFIWTERVYSVGKNLAVLFKSDPVNRKMWKFLVTCMGYAHLMMTLTVIAEVAVYRKTYIKEIKRVRRLENLKNSLLVYSLVKLNETRCGELGSLPVPTSTDHPAAFLNWYNGTSIVTRRLGLDDDKTVAIEDFFTDGALSLNRDSDILTYLTEFIDACEQF